MNTKTVYFKTLGCKVNQYETQSMRERIQSLGVNELDHPEGADCLILNSCTVTHQSDRKALYYVRRFKKTNPQGKVILTGCLANNDPNHLLQKDYIDMVLPNEEKGCIDQVYARLFDTPLLPIPTPHEKTITSFKGHVRAFVKVQDGCNMNCSYCKVRIVRGRSRSRGSEHIISEVRTLVENGYKEIVLTGVQIGSYGKDLTEKRSLATLLEDIAMIPGIERSRLSSIEPFDLTEELLATIARMPSCCHHFHIPLQSGDNNVLVRMRRAYTREEYQSLIQSIRARIPACGISTDVIIGFPGEDDEAFSNTMELLETIGPHKVHIFPFSPREGTDAFLYHDTVASRIVSQREKIAETLQQRLFNEYAQQFIGTVEPVLIEGGYQQSATTCVGRTSHYPTTYLVNSDGHD